MLDAAVSLRARLLSGPAALGTCVQTPHPVMSEFLGGLGLDFLFIDAEHSAMGRETVERLVAAATPTPALVRVSENTAATIGAALDSGAAGVVVPRVDSGEEAEAAVSFARYPPLGRRGAGPGRAALYGLGLEEYVARANETLVLAVQVETRAALDRLDDILAVQGVDLVFFGPGDLAVSLGVSSASPELDGALQSALARSAAVGRRTGIYVGDAKQVRRRMEQGARLVVLASDLAFLEAGLRDARRVVEGHR